MGLTHVTTKVQSLDKTGNPYVAEFLVDTGAIHCMAPGDALMAAGVQPEGKAVYELANGEPVEYEYGFARLGFAGDEIATKVIFGPAHSEPLLGVVALESAGVMVDPMSRSLRRLPALPLKIIRREGPP
jgi:predicted aspartyl protease